MKKIFICKLIILVSGLFALTEDVAMARMTVEKVSESVDLSKYSQLRIERIDVRDIIFEVYDDEDLEYFPESLDDQVLNNIAVDLYEHFYVQLKNVTEINDSEDYEADASLLVLNLSLKARFTAGEQGAMIKWLFRMHESESVIFLECQLINPLDNSVVLLVKDQHKLKSPSADDPLSTEEELEALSRIFRAWSTRFSKVYTQLQVNKDFPSND